jgi:hypothetical protein
MEITEIGDIILSWETMISETMRRRIHYYSMRNFVLHFDEIQIDKVKEKICRLLTEYIEEVKANDFDFEVRASYFMSREYLPKLAEYYKEYARFMRIINIKEVLTYGLFVDSLLYISGLLTRIWDLPIMTIGVFLYYLFVKVFKEPKGRVYAIFYQLLRTPCVLP